MGWRDGNVAQKRKRQRPKSLALPSLIISQRGSSRLRLSVGQLFRLAPTAVSFVSAFG
jgi:hypothetical protein